MKLENLQPAEGSRQVRTRVGRGHGSGRGKTSGRGTKGQWARTGGGVRPGFEGGQMPLYRRLPKRGFNNKFKTFYALVQINDLNIFPAETVVDLGMLQEVGLVNKPLDGVKILGMGELTHPLTVRATAFSASAIAKINAAGGKVEVI
ncbi:MAG: 50S ribosomal protein L15 [Peptococcaceae bacterium]|nr:50S ribosomal protein L15 [Peptococcaceae bacterium]MBT9135090.1 50S ribosomal protein L15 [Bacillota bacterium]